MFVCASRTHVRSKPFRGTRARCLAWLVAIACCAPVDVAWPHPISMVDAQTYVSPSRVVMRLQIFAEDLYLFHNLEPDAADVLSAEQLADGTDRHRDFLRQRVYLRDADGQRIEGQVTDVEPLDVPLGIPVGDLMQHSLTYQLEFTLPSPPEFLTFEQEIADANFLFPSEMKLQVKQAAVADVRTQILRPGEPLTVRFAWDDELPPEDTSSEQWAKWFERQQNETLGISSYGSVYSFLYIEPFEVRHEVLIPLASLAALVPIERADAAFLTVAEQQAAREVLEEYFRERIPLAIDGRPAVREFDRIDFYGLDFRDFAQRPEARQVSMVNGRVGLILSYDATEPPRSVRLTWDVFTASIRRVETVVFAFDEIQKTAFVPKEGASEDTFTWSTKTPPTRPRVTPVRYDGSVEPSLWRVPHPALMLVGFSLAAGAWFLGPAGIARRLLILVAVLGVFVATLWLPAATVSVEVAGPPPVPDARAWDIFEQLHRQIYLAFEKSDDEAIYDDLSVCATAPLRRRLFLEIQESLRQKQQGGAVAHVTSIDYPEDGWRQLERDGPGFRCQATWHLTGTVEHWGHVHQRRHAYTADFTIRPVEDQWRIAAFEVVQEQQLGSSTTLRKWATPPEDDEGNAELPAR